MADENDNVVDMTQRDREASADFDATGVADAGGGEGDGQSIEELEAQKKADEEADGQFAFVVPETGKKITLGTMIPRNVPVELAYKMSGKSIPNVKGGLIDPSDTAGLLLVSYVVEDVDVKFTRDSDGEITKATIYTVLAPKRVVNAHSEAGASLMGGVEATA